MLKINKIKVPFHKWYSHKLWLIHDVAKAFNSHPQYIYDNYGNYRTIYKSSIDNIIAHSKTKYRTVKPLLSGLKDYLNNLFMLYQLLERFYGKSSPIKFYKILITTRKNSFIYGNRVVNSNGTVNTFNDISNANRYVKRHINHSNGKVLVSSIEDKLNSKDYLSKLPYLHVHTHMLAMGIHLDSNHLQSLLDKHYPNEFKITVRPFTVNPSSTSPQLTLGDYSLSTTIKSLKPFVKYLYKDCNHQLNEVSNLSVWQKVNPKARYHVYRVIYNNDNRIQLHNHFRAKSAIEKTVNQINIIVTLINLTKIRFYLNKYQVISQSNLFDPTKYNHPVYSNLYTNIPHHHFMKSYHQINLFKPVKYCNKSIINGQSLMPKQAKARITVGTIRDEPILNVNGNSYLIRVSQYHIKSVKIQSDYIFNSS